MKESRRVESEEEFYQRMEATKQKLVRGIIKYLIISAIGCGLMFAGFYKMMR